MTLLFATLSILLAVALTSLHFLVRLRRLNAVKPENGPLAFPVSNRYQPMLRLFSPEDNALLASNKALARKLKRQRTQLFREYLACLSRDYARLLAGIRLQMVHSAVDRPDLAAALARNQALFAFAVCRIEYRIFLHRFGLSPVDVSGLVEALNALRAQSAAFTPAVATGR